MALVANGEQVLLTLLLPLLALVGLTRTSWVPLPVPTGASRIDVVAPGVLAVAILSTSFTSQAISFAFDRRQGVLRLLGTTPLGRGGLLAGRIGSVLVVQCLQSVVLGTAAAALGWRPHWSWLPVAALVAVLGSAALVSFGLALGGTMRAEGVLAVANLVWVLLVAGGAVLLPATAAGPFGPIAALLPSGALGEGLRSALLHGTLPGRDLVVLAGWALAGGLLARRVIRWD